MNYQKPKGTSDILPKEAEKWQFVEETARLLFRDYMYQEIRTPIFEHYEVIARSVGDTTDIVSKEMYDFYDKGDRHVTLRPEGTAPIVRSFVENKLFGPEHSKPYKVFYTGPMFRYERPQAGRQRQFHQIGVEAFGSDNPALDVEVMAMALDFFRQLGLSETRLVLNTLGDKESRSAYRTALIAYLEKHEEALSADSKRRLRTNPLRVLDSKEKQDLPIVKEAPAILDYLNDASRQHFESVKAMLELLEIPFTVDATMVRGLDYYTHTIFEIMTTEGAQSTLCGGGRYDGLVEEFGGPATSGMGFALGVERLLLTMEKEGVTIPTIDEIDVYVVGIGAETNGECLKLVQAVRSFGYAANRDFLDRKPKAQFKTANKERAKLVMTLGSEELANRSVKIKNMQTGFEKTSSLAAVYQDFNPIYAEMFQEKLENQE